MVNKHHTNQKMKKIVFLNSSMGRGGAERVISILANEYCVRGWQVEIVMLLHNICEYPLDERVKVIDLSYANEKNAIFRWVKMLKALRGFIKKGQPDVVVPFHAKVAALSEIAFWGMRKEFRMVSSERIDPYSVKYSKILRWLIDRAFTHADAVVFQTEKAKSFYSKKIQVKSEIIGNPVSLQLQKSDKVNPIIISAGRLEKQKNQKMLIQAFSEIANDFPKYELHIYGEGSLRKELEQQIKELGLQDRVKLPGNHMDYQNRLCEADIFVLSSDFEGLSNALLEAMVLGMPCISTDCAGSDEVVQSENNGLLVPVGDMTALAEAMGRMLSDDELKKRLGKAAKITTRSYRTENVISKWREILERGI